MQRHQQNDSVKQKGNVSCNISITQCFSENYDNYVKSIITSVSVWTKHFNRPVANATGVYYLLAVAWTCHMATYIRVNIVSDIDIIWHYLNLCWIIIGEVFWHSPSASS